MSKTKGKSISKWTKSIFDTYILMNATSVSYKRLYTAFNLLCQGSKLLNTISILSSATTFIKGYSASSYLIQFFSYTRFDILLSTKSSQLSFAILILSSLALKLLAKLILMIQIQYKKTFIRFVFITIVRVVNLISTYTLMIPGLNFCLNAFFINFQKIELNDYGDELLRDFAGLRAFLAVFLFPLVLMLVLETVFGNVPKFKKNLLSRAHSSVQVKEVVVIILLLCFRIMINNKFFFVVAIGLGSYQAYLFFTFLPFINNLMNLAYLQTWTSLVVFGFLAVVSEMYENFSILELVFPFTFLALIVFNHEAIKKRSEKLKGLREFPNPYIAELSLRFKLQESPENAQNLIHEHFKQVTENFFVFDLQYIWESLIVNTYLKDKSLALMKLNKSNLCRSYKSLENYRSNQNMNFQYNIRPEVKFLKYYLFSKILSRMPEMSSDIILISYSNNQKKFKENEKKLLMKLRLFSFSVYERSSSKSFNSRINTLGTYIRGYFRTAQKIMKKFGNEKGLVRQYQSFCDDILNADYENLNNKDGLYRRIGKKLSKKFSRFDNFGSFLIISGSPDELGKIIYANKSLCTLLKVNSPADLVGKYFTKMIPAPFDAINNNALIQHVMFGEKSTIHWNHMLITDSFGACIEISMALRLSFYKQNMYFLLNFKQHLPTQAFVVVNTEDVIVGISPKFASFIGTESNDLNSILPSIKSYLDQNSENEAFLYEQSILRLYAKYKRLRIRTSELTIVYVVEECEQESFGLRFESIKTSEDFLSETSKLCPISLNKFKDNDQEEKYNKTTTWTKYSRASRILSILIKSFSIAQILIMLCLLIAIYKIVDELTLSFIIFDTGLMRYLSTSTINNIHSLDLIHKNFSVAFPEAFYRTEIDNNMNKLQIFLNTYNKISIPVTGDSKSYFNSEKLLVSYDLSNSTSYKSEFLVNIINKFITDSKLIANTTFANFNQIHKQKTFLYKNIPTLYINALNTTVFNIMNDLTKTLDQIFYYIERVELVALIVPGVLLGISLYCLLQIELGNRLLWQKINKIDSFILNRFSVKVSDRLRIVHKHVESPDIFENKDLKNHSSLIILKPFCKLLGFTVITLGFYFTITQGSQDLLHQVIKHDLIHTNFGGLRRMLTPLSLFWARNLALETIHKDSYNDWFEYNSVTDLKQELEYIISKYESTQGLLMNSLREYPLNKFSFHNYLQLMYGESCQYILTVNNCTSSFLSQGLDSALRFYIEELRNLYGNNDENRTLTQMITVEKYSKTIEKSFVAGLVVYANYTTEVINSLKTDLQVTIILYCLAVVVYFILFLRTLSKSLTDLFENKIYVTNIFSQVEILSIR